MSPAEVTEKLGLHRMRDRSWFVHPSCATSGEVGGDCKLTKEYQLSRPCSPLQGLFEGLSWLSANVKAQPPRA